MRVVVAVRTGRRELMRGSSGESALLPLASPTQEGGMDEETGRVKEEPERQDALIVELAGSEPRTSVKVFRLLKPSPRSSVPRTNAG